ncbi:hypothetical protein NH340_JMT07358 [Sarcoptes scabiei]|nr:hypothetical protein NH340_JMT07358 [Sarcoptes scabiei]
MTNREENERNALRVPLWHYDFSDSMKENRNFIATVFVLFSMQMNNFYNRFFGRMVQKLSPYLHHQDFDLFYLSIFFSNRLVSIISDLFMSLSLLSNENDTVIGEIKFQSKH